MGKYFYATKDKKLSDLDNCLDVNSFFRIPLKFIVRTIDPNIATKRINPAIKKHTR